MELIHAYRKAMKEADDNIIKQLANGGASSWEDYRHIVGIRKGLYRALDVFEDEVKKLVDEKDEQGY
jgi:hypothetical protein